jgi:hypothetical protein
VGDYGRSIRSLVPVWFSIDLEALDRGLMNTWRVGRQAVGEAVAAVAVVLCLGVAGTACNDITTPNNGVVKPPSTRPAAPLVGGDVLPPVKPTLSPPAGGTPRDESSPPTNAPEPIHHPPANSPQPIHHPPTDAPQPIQQPPTDVAVPIHHPPPLGPPNPPLWCGPDHSCSGPPPGPPHERPAPPAPRPPEVGTIRPPITTTKPDDRKR